MQEVFYYKDIVDTEEIHIIDPISLTTIALMSLRRFDFCELIHKHPTLILRLLDRQHIRLYQ